MCQYTWLRGFLKMSFFSTFHLKFFFFSMCVVSGHVCDGVTHGTCLSLTPMLVCRLPHGWWGFELGSFCFHSKTLMHWSIFSALNPNSWRTQRAYSSLRTHRMTNLRPARLQRMAGTPRCPPAHGTVCGQSKPPFHPNSKVFLPTETCRRKKRCNRCLQAKAQV